MLNRRFGCADPRISRLGATYEIAGITALPIRFMRQPVSSVGTSTPLRALALLILVATQGRKAVVWLVIGGPFELSP